MIEIMVLVLQAYYRKYPERTKDLNNLIDAIKNTTSLEIYIEIMNRRMKIMPFRRIPKYI